MTLFFFGSAMVQRSIRQCALAMAVVTLAGCASLTPPATSADSTATPTASTASGRPFHPTIALQGRISVRYQRNGNDEALHGSYIWNQTPQQTVVTLLTPLGQTIATIEVIPGRAVLTQANQAPRTAADVDRLAAETLGWPLPVAGLQQWLQGFAIDANGQPFIAQPNAGDANSVTTQDDWRIRYVGWESDVLGGHGLPKRIDLQRHTRQAGEVTIRIVIDAAQAS